MKHIRLVALTAIVFAGLAAVNPFPRRIRLTGKTGDANLKGLTLTRYDGRPYNVTANGGKMTVAIETGDYLGGNCVINEHWLRDNPDGWEPA
jgi:hypothetical protein